MIRGSHGTAPGGAGHGVSAPALAWAGVCWPSVSVSQLACVKGSGRSRLGVPAQQLGSAVSHCLWAMFGVAGFFSALEAVFSRFPREGGPRRRVTPGNSCSSASEREAGHVSYRSRPRKPGNPALHSWSYRRTRSSPAVRGVWIVAGLAFPDPPGELWEVRKSSSLDCPASTRTDAPTLSLPQSGTRPS